MISDEDIKQTGKSDIIVTVAREYGSGGMYVGKLLAEKLEIKFYDKDLIEIISKLITN